MKKMDKNKKNILISAIALVVLLVIVLGLVFFLPKEKAPEKPKESYCGDGVCDANETFGTCGKDCCYPEGEYLPIVPDVKCCEGLETGTNYDMNCVINHDYECEPCILVGASPCINCGNGICGLGENFCNCIEDCKPTAMRMGIYGYVTVWGGDCMPPIGPSCKKEFVETKVKVYEPIKESEMQGNYLSTDKKPLIAIDSDELGYYYFELPNGMYSVFAEDPVSDDKDYCNSFSNGYACLVTVSNKLSKFDVNIDHATH